MSATVSSAQIKTPATSSYVPAVGDVAECDHEGKHYKVVIYRHLSSVLCVANEDCPVGSADNVSNLVKVGHTDIFDGLSDLNTHKADDIAEAYFAQEKKKPDYQVGELVRNTMGDREAEVIEVDVYANRMRLQQKSGASAWYNLDGHFELVTKQKGQMA